MYMYVHSLVHTDATFCSADKGCSCKKQFETCGTHCAASDWCKMCGGKVSSTIAAHANHS